MRPWVQSLAQNTKQEQKPPLEIVLNFYLAFTLLVPQFYPCMKYSSRCQIEVFLRLASAMVYREEHTRKER
jgi:hypothetical protein